MRLFVAYPVPATWRGATKTCGHCLLWHRQSHTPALIWVKE